VGAIESVGQPVVITSCHDPPADPAGAATSAYALTNTRDGSEESGVREIGDDCVMRIRAEVCRTSSELPLRLAHPVRRSWTVAALAEALETPWKQTPRAAEATAAFEPTGEEV